MSNEWINITNDPLLHDKRFSLITDKTTLNLYLIMSAYNSNIN